MLFGRTFEEIKMIFGVSLVEIEGEVFIIDKCEICGETFFNKIIEDGEYIMFSIYCGNCNITNEGGYYRIKEFEDLFMLCYDYER